MIFKYHKTPIMIGECNKEDIAEEYRAHIIMAFGYKLFVWKTYTGNKYRKVRQLSVDDKLTDLKQGNKIVYSPKDFIPYEYELIP